MFLYGGIQYKHASLYVRVSVLHWGWFYNWNDYSFKILDMKKNVAWYNISSSFWPSVCLSTHWHHCSFSVFQFSQCKETLLNLLDAYSQNLKERVLPYAVEIKVGVTYSGCGQISYIVTCG